MWKLGANSTVKCYFIRRSNSFKNQTIYLSGIDVRALLTSPMDYYTATKKSEEIFFYAAICTQCHWNHSFASISKTNSFSFCSLDACIFLFLQRLPRDAHFLFLFYKIFVILALLRSLIKLIRFVHISIRLWVLLILWQL